MIPINDPSDEAALIERARRGAERRFARACQAARGAAGAAADPGRLLSRHPLITLAAATAAGCIAGIALRRWARPTRTLAVDAAATAPPSRRGRGVLRLLVEDVLAPLLIDRVAALVRASAAPTAPTAPESGI